MSQLRLKKIRSVRKFERVWFVGLVLFGVMPKPIDPKKLLTHPEQTPEVTSEIFPPDLSDFRDGILVRFCREFTSLMAHDLPI